MFVSNAVAAINLPFLFLMKSESVFSLYIMCLANCVPTFLLAIPYRASAVYIFQLYVVSLQVWTNINRVKLRCLGNMIPIYANKYYYST